MNSPTVPPAFEGLKTHSVHLDRSGINSICLPLMLHVQYVKWAGTNKDGFWTNPTARRFYFNHVRSVVTRVNSFTGVAYSDDPTILGWDLFNEMRCPEAQTPPGW